MVMRTKLMLYIFIIIIFSCKEEKEDFDGIEITKFGNKKVSSFYIDNSGLIFEINKESNKVIYFKRQLTKKKLDRIYESVVKLDSLDIDKDFNGVDYDFYFIKILKNKKEIFSFQELYKYKPSLTKNDSLFSELIKIIETTKKDSVLTNFSKYQNFSKVIDNEVKATQ